MSNWWIMQRLSEAHRQEMLDEAERQRLASDCRKPSFLAGRLLVAAMAAVGLTVTTAAIYGIM